MPDITPDHPAVEEVRRHWGLSVDIHRRPERLAEFDRMIRALKAEAWEEGVADNERGWQHVYAGHDIDPDDPLAICQTCCTPNPYREAIR